MILELPHIHIKAILGRDDLFVESEDLVFQLVIDYIEGKEKLQPKETESETQNQ